ncbi:hypothetical protein BaRGS_00007362 [Batillaria attramentaria]|uniref:Uncharacterized protein n=1 Tax=Batillaria attramentaria TaxID=370345 RepID=A0ABD0LQ82_9CAEN
MASLVGRDIITSLHTTLLALRMRVQVARHFVQIDTRSSNTHSTRGHHQIGVLIRCWSEAGLHKELVNIRFVSGWSWGSADILLQSAFFPYSASAVLLHRYCPVSSMIGLHGEIGRCDDVRRIIECSG